MQVLRVEIPPEEVFGALGTNHHVAEYVGESPFCSQPTQSANLTHELVEFDEPELGGGFNQHI